jgi:hypothetical protein
VPKAVVSTRSAPNRFEDPDEQCFFGKFRKYSFSPSFRNKSTILSLPSKSSEVKMIADLFESGHKLRRIPRLFANRKQCSIIYYGPHFIAEVIEEFLSLIGKNKNQHCLTLAYSKVESALVERMNKEVNRHCDDIITLTSEVLR